MFDGRRAGWVVYLAVNGVAVDDEDDHGLELLDESEPPKEKPPERSVSDRVVDPPLWFTLLPSDRSVDD
jgi:hypothetical protein